MRPIVPLLVCVLISACVSAPAALRPADRVPAGGAAQARAPAGERAPSSPSPAAAFAPLDLPRPDRLRGASGAPGPDYWQQRVDYSIDAELDPGELVLRATARITYTNNSPDPLEYLWLTLEQDAFRRGSLADRLTDEPSPFSRGIEGGYRIHALRTGGRDLNLVRYDTCGRVELPAPIPPDGGRLELELEWSFPIMTERTERLGVEDVAQGRIVQVANWFPALCVYDDVQGWNTLPFLVRGEFYTDFGDFDVRLRVPREYLVAATGELENPEEVLTAAQRERLGRARATTETTAILRAEEVGTPAARPAGVGPLTWRFRARDVRTFAWAVSDAFLWDASSTEGVLVQSFYPSEARENWSKATDMLRWSIEFYGRLATPYPYPVASNVHGPEVGMEFPMIVFCEERFDELGLFFVTTHEIGHNWFPMLVNTDERRHPWMDEGFDSFINIYAVRERYPGVDFFDAVPDLILDADEFAVVQAELGSCPMDTAHDLMPEHAAGFLAYEKPAFMLVLLREQVLGPERFDAAFRSYVRRWAFKSPRPADFFRCMEDAAGSDLAWFWRSWVLESTQLDLAIDGVELGQGRLSVTIANRGTMPMPFEYTVTFRDGERATRRVPVAVWARGWTFRDEWHPNREPVRIELDPDRRLPDVDRSNDVWER